MYTAYTAHGLRSRRDFEQIKQRAGRYDKSSVRASRPSRGTARFRDKRAAVVADRHRGELKRNRNGNKVFGGRTLSSRYYTVNRLGEFNKSSGKMTVQLTKCILLF